MKVNEQKQKIKMSILIAMVIIVISSEVSAFSSISGYKLNDADNTGIQNWNITLLSDNNAVIGIAHTDNNGFYSFNNLINGIYTIIEEIKEGWMNISESHFIVTINSDNTAIINKNFVNIRVPTPTPTPTATATLTPTPTPTSVQTPTPTPTPEIVTPKFSYDDNSNGGMPVRTPTSTPTLILTPTVITPTPTPVPTEVVIITPTLTPTPVPTIESIPIVITLPSNVVVWDINKDNKISRVEAISSVQAYFGGFIDKETVLSVLIEYFNG